MCFCNNGKSFQPANFLDLNQVVYVVQSNQIQVFNDVLNGNRNQMLVKCFQGNPCGRGSRPDTCTCPDGATFRWYFGDEIMKMVVLMAALMAVLMWYNSSARSSRLSENLFVMINHLQTVNPFKLLLVLSYQVQYVH